MKKKQIYKKKLNKSIPKASPLINKKNKSKSRKQKHFNNNSDFTPKPIVNDRTYIFICNKR